MRRSLSLHASREPRGSAGSGLFFSLSAVVMQNREKSYRDSRASLLAPPPVRWRSPLSTSLRLTEQLTACALGDRNDRRMFESALDGDDIEPLAHIFQAADDRYAVLVANACLD